MLRYDGLRIDYKQTNSNIISNYDVLDLVVVYNGDLSNLYGLSYSCLGVKMGL